MHQGVAEQPALKRREQWFEAGVVARQRLAPSAPPEYLCPLCGRSFSRDALKTRLLTEEHAPSRAVGGRVVCLTCVECNKGAGHTFDAAVRQYENLLDFVQGRMKQPRPAKFDVFGTRTNVTVQHEAGHFRILGRPRYSNPTDQARVQAEFDRLSRQGSGQAFNFRITPYEDAPDPSLAQVGWLRFAYLIAFAAFGYRYAFHALLKPVRQQITHPKQQAIECFHILAPDAPCGLRLCLLVEEPRDLRSLVVMMGRHAIYLPWDSLEVYDQTAERARKRFAGPETLNGKVVPWPTGPRHTLDSPSTSRV